MIFIVIPVFNRWQYTSACLDSLAAQRYRDFTVVVVDHGSTDETAANIRKTYDWVTLLRGDGSMWWTAAVNMGIEHALRSGAQYILTLNNDLVVNHDYLEALMKTAEEHPRTLVGSVSVDIDNSEQLTFAGVNWNAMTAKYADAIPMDTPYSILRKNFSTLGTGLLPGRGMLVPANVFKDTGLFDEAVFPHYGADEDFSLRAKSRGYALTVCTAAVVMSRMHGPASQSLISRRSKFRMGTRWQWARRHGKVPLLYFVLDMLRISKSLLFRKGN